MITTDFRVAKKVAQVVWIGGWYGRKHTYASFDDSPTQSCTQLHFAPPIISQSYELARRSWTVCGTAGLWTLVVFMCAMMCAVLNQPGDGRLHRQNCIQHGGRTKRSTRGSRARCVYAQPSLLRALARVPPTEHRHLGNPVNRAIWIPLY